MSDLRPLVDDLDDSLDDIRPVTARLDRDTNVVGTYLSMIQVFVGNTTSIFGFHDGNGGNIRGHVGTKIDAEHSLPGGDPGYSPTPADAGTGPGVPSGATPLPFYVRNVDSAALVYVPGGDDWNPGYNERHGSNSHTVGGK